MLFITLCDLRPGMFEEGGRRRAEWTPPEGMHFVAEYWLPTLSPRVIFIAEAEDASAVFHGLFEWEDVFDMRTYPALTGEEGLQLMKEMVAAVPAGV